MIQKFLLIGVGGSGGTTLRYTWRELDRRLRATGWRRGVPQTWRFLHIDVPHEPDIIEGDVPATIGDSGSYVGLAAPPRQYREYDDSLVRRDGVLPAVAGWRPDPRQDYTSPWKGAGQRRVVGRVISLTKLGDIVQQLNAEVAALANTSADTELRELGAHLGAAVDTDARRPIIISSLGGGAGSGMVLDIIELLKARATQQAQWLDNALTILYASDVFGHLTPAQRSGVEPNSLAAIAELLAAFEHEGPVPTLEDRLLDVGRGTVPISGRRTGLYNFIIGRRNQAITFPTSYDVFRSVGKALATIMADEKVGTQFESYLQSNWPASPVMDEFAITDLNRMNHPCSSFGYASVSLGRSLFEQYASERLARRAVERLLYGHTENADPTRREDALIRDRVEAHRTIFFNDSGLHELDSDNNQVLDAFRDPDEKTRRLNDVATQVQEKLRADRRERKPADWLMTFTSSFDDVAREFAQAEREERARRASEWVEPIQARVRATVARYAGRVGLPVTLALVQELENQVLEAAEELERANQAFLRKEASALETAKHVFDSIRQRTVTTKLGEFETAGQKRREALMRRTEAELYDFTASVLREVAKGFLPQLRSALKRAEAQLNSDVKNESKAVFEQWSTHAVPVHLQPAPNELLIEPAAGFPTQLDALLCGQFQTDAADDAESLALEEIISGAWSSILEPAGDVREQHLVDQPQKWRPTLSGAREIGAAAATARFEIEIDAHSMLEASSLWMRERRDVSGYVHETLRSWLDPERTDAAARATKFAAAIQQALKNAAPFVSINPNTLRVVHGDSDQRPALIISDIPVASDHRAREPIEKALLAAGVDRGRIPALFDPNSPSSEVELTTFVGRSVHPVVFDSLMGPIQEDWKARTEEGSRRQFWQFRRSRTLTAFVPISPTRQRALVRGWLTAMLLGHVPFLARPWSEEPLSIWTPRGHQGFPQFLLGDEVRDHWAVLPALMESMPLALTTFAGGDDEELRAYLRLIELGKSSNGSLEAYHDANRELAMWIEAAVTLEPDPGFPEAPTPLEAVAGNADQTADERAATMATKIRTFEAAYRDSVGNQKITRESSLTVGGPWEIRDLVSLASRELAAAIERAPHRAAPNVDPFVTPTPPR